MNSTSIRFFETLFTFIFFITFQVVFSQIKNDSLKIYTIDSVLISNKLPKNVAVIPTQINILTSKQIEFQNFQTMAEVLSNSGNLFVQKSQQGGGSPVIRGFEASRVLLMVDGIRMNNLIFRAGHLQNVITIDENMLDNVGIFYGPTSTLFGSDALGGTVSMNTKKPKYLNQVKYKFSGDVVTRYGSVNHEKSVAFGLNYATTNFASLTSFSFNDFGDLRMGKQKNHKASFFGERPFYVATINGVDQIVENSNRFIQKESGYKQYNLMQKLAYKTTSGFEHELNFQFSTTSNINRYDRLTETNATTGFTHAQWYYGPQKRILAIYSLQKKKAFLDSDFKLNVAFQDVEESRHNRRFGNYNLQHRIENVKMYSIGLDLIKNFKKSQLFYGFESYFETLNSSAFSKNINTSEIKNISTRYPNGDNTILRNDFYFSFNHTISPTTFYSAGGRIGYTTLKSTINNDMFFPLPFSEINQNTLTYSGSIGITHNTSQNFTIKSNLSTGFRVPNIDDLAKIFESNQGRIIVPNDAIKPEKSITADFGIIIQSDNKKIKFENTYFYTWLRDMIVVDNFLYNGQSNIIYDGTPSDVFANQNKRRAFTTGISTSFFAELANDFDFNATFNYTLGRVVENGTQTPLDHIAPFFGKIGFLYTNSKFNAEVFMLYNGKKALKNYSDSGEDNLQFAPANGMPSWETYHFKIGYNLIKNATLYTGVENILDTQYRTFASGINAPGRNFYGGIRYGF